MLPTLLLLLVLDSLRCFLAGRRVSLALLSSRLAFGVSYFNNAFEILITKSSFNKSKIPLLFKGTT